MRALNLPLNPPVSRRALRALVAAGATLCAVAGLAADAHATEIDGDLNRFVISDGTFFGQPAVNGPDVYAADVTTVDGQSVWRIVTESPIRAVMGTCTRISGQNNVAGPSEVHCRRGATPTENFVSLGGGDDVFVAGPGFPDRLRLNGANGNDTLTGGAAKDIIIGGDGDNVLTGNEGDDLLTLGNPPRTQFSSFPNGRNVLDGGPGADRVSGADGPDTVRGGDGEDLLSGGRAADVLTGGEGDDNLTGGPENFSKRDELRGGAGTDTYRGEVIDQIFARDGIPEQVFCFPASRFVKPDPLAFAEVDLKDSISFGQPCPIVLRAPVNERPSVRITSQTVRVRGRTARVKVRCITAKTCRGKLVLRLSRRSARKVSVRYRVSGKRTRSIPVRLRRADAAKVTRKGVKATASLTEKGIMGAKTVKRAVTAKR